MDPMVSTSGMEARQRRNRFPSLDQADKFAGGKICNKRTRNRGRKSPVAGKKKVCQTPILQTHSVSPKFIGIERVTMVTGES